jgi:sugar phosphate isomerase/epimerase
MSIRLGANPIIWSNDDMRDLGAETPLETYLAEARLIGFEGMELGHKFPRDPLQRPLSEHPLLKGSEWREFGRRLTEVAAVTAAEGVRLAYHHHMGTVVSENAP